MIYTLCKSCNTINSTIIDRCKWCGSRQVEVKAIQPELIKHTSKREIYKPSLNKK